MPMKEAESKHVVDTNIKIPFGRHPALAWETSAIILSGHLWDPI